MTRAATALALAVLLAAPLLHAQDRATASAIPVQLGVAAQPETVTVGDPLRITVRVRAPAGATIAFPDAPDTTGALQPLDPREVAAGPPGDASEATAIYRLVAWDVGAQTARLGDVVVRLGTLERRVSLAGAGVFVRSVLPADSALRVPKPPRDPFELPTPWWWLAALLLGILGVLLLLWWWWRRRQRGAPEKVEDAYELARRELARIEGLGLVEAGERGRFVALVVDVVREYLARRVAVANVALTSTELLDAVRADHRVPLGRLAPVLAETDLVKFARRPVTAERARELAREARAVIEEVEQATVAAAAAASAARKAAA